MTQRGANVNKKRSSEPTPTTARLEALRLADLVPHPDQAKCFRKHGPFERVNLKRDIRANGVKHPPEVMPPGNAAGLRPYTTVTGHTRLEILGELGHTTAEVLVRYDLINATAAAVKKLFLTDNGARRQQSRFDQARYAVELYQVEREEAGKRPASDPLSQEELCARVGQIMGVSGKTFQRYRNVLRAPAAVQDAFEKNRVTLVDAARVATLPRADQQRLADRLRAGDDPKAAFAAFFPPKGRGHASANNAVAAFARSLEAAGANITDRLGEVKAGVVRQNKERLRAGGTLIKVLLQKLDRAG